MKLYFCPLQARKDPTQRSLEARLRNARYLAELTKFRLAPFGTFFSLLKQLLDDFAGHNVDAAAALVETAGRFLYRLPETQTRITNMLDVRDLPLRELEMCTARKGLCMLASSDSLCMSMDRQGLILWQSLW